MADTTVWFITGAARGVGIDIARRLPRFGRIDALVHDAGTFQTGFFEQIRDLVRAPDFCQPSAVAS